ncbi:hypothetical protein [Curtobacterium sp. VKM Ac-2922]|uniref:hypothetical protein n=1 Tax=Curtobacterium sp. VKM Ac-2922 TaxID=2929475 RepID=UPI001FB305D6|nr:hypothetical protein [Curtobacterium sp. VKM Ac-2922]MCJ1713959.1 hypothetical protein [Curtobacterium sp. VKM Ac-2922]
MSDAGVLRAEETVGAECREPDPDHQEQQPGRVVISRDTVDSARGAGTCERGPMIPPLHAWGDESVRTHTAGQPRYLLAASVVDSNDVEASRALLEDLRPTRGKLHWHDLNDRQRKRVIAAVAEIDAVHLIVIAAPMDPRREERARAVCLERLGWELARQDVALLTLEQRATALAARDLRVVEALRGRRIIPASLRVEHGDPTAEPMLWLPDQVLGAFGAASEGHPVPPSLSAAIETYDVEP